MYKVVLLGNRASGKTALLYRYIHNNFKQGILGTIGFDISIKRISNQEFDYSIVFWDISGLEKHDSLMESYLDCSQGAILVYSKTDKESFDNIKKWFKLVHDKAGNIPVVLVGTKKDLEDEHKVSEEEGLKLAREIGAIAFFETSAKTGENINKAFEEISTKVPEIEVKIKLDHLLGQKILFN